MSNSPVWALEPHTIAKHELLEGYLDAWFPIICRYNNQVNYIDGFAGPGQYAGGEKGSPIIAIESAMRHIKNKTISSSVKLNFFFVERDKNCAAHLNAQLEPFRAQPQFQIEVIEGEFSKEMSSALDVLETENKNPAPIFAFIDPFGFSGIPMSLVARILQFPRCEVFINLMAEHINRFLQHPDEGVTSHFPVTFGTDEVLEIPHRDGNRLANILDLYRDRLRRYAEYVGRFDMRGRKDQKTYSLFFATNNASGFIKMKEAMWVVDKHSGNLFSDADPTPVSLFAKQGFEPLWDELKMEFAGRTVPMSVLEKFVIEKTDYLPKHARDILTRREKSNEITAQALPGFKRRAKSFPNDKVQITFPS